MPGTTPDLGPHRRSFAHLLANTLVVSVTNMTMWFAVTFWVYLETRVVLLTNVALWTLFAVFSLRSSIVLLAVAFFLCMTLMPLVEAAEQTVLQKVVPYERQGRVFGFAQSVEQSASPLTAFLISPLAQFVAIPFMTTGRGADWFGGWFGTGPDRGMALVFVLTGLLGLVLTLIALRTPWYRLLSDRYQEAGGEDVPAGRVEPVAGGTAAAAEAGLRSPA